MGYTIAVVEDNPDNRLLIQAILEDEFDVAEYETGASALKGMDESPPDLVLMDISLPEMDGRDVLKEMKKRARLAEIPVIALTAHAMAGDRERFLAAGFDAYVTKPIIDDQMLFKSIYGLIKRI